MSEHPLLPEQPSTFDQIRRFGPPAAIAVASVLFIVQNTDTVSFNFLWFEFSWPLWIMLIVFMATGAIVAYGIAWRVRSRRASRLD